MQDERSKERLSFVRPGWLPETEVMVVFDSFRPWHVFHERYAFCGCRAASAGWRYRGQSLFLNDGSSMLLEPGETHCNTVVHKPADFQVLLIDPEVFKSAARELGVAGTPHFRFGQVEDPRLIEALYRFTASMEGGGTLLEQQARFACFVQRVLGHAEQTPSHPDTVNGARAVERAKRYLQERYREPVGLEELSAAAGMSRFHLARTFMRHVGIPPHAYQIHVRIERATALLRSGFAPADAAARVGFADQSHFTRHFKRIWRTTPSHYARAA